MNEYANYEKIDLSDIPEVRGSKKSRRNPFYERIMRDGFSITEYYSPEDVAEISRGNFVKKMDIFTLDPEEQLALKKYEEKHGVIH